MHKIKLLLILMLLPCGCSASVRTGLDNVHNYRPLFENKRIGVITNHTACNKNGQFILDVFGAMETVTIAAAFGPEHGFTGKSGAGEKVATVAESEYGFPIYSLYGEHSRPTAEMLRDIDVLVFDIQDVGARFYTYIYTMARAMETAAEHNKKFIVLDRPNPITAAIVQGNVLDPEFSSSIGMFPIPVRYAMTPGELAKLFDAKWLKKSLGENLTIIPMSNYKRDLWYDQTGLKFISPSPNIISLDTAVIYPGTCLLEGTNISEGRGTSDPFLLFGAPWIDAEALTQRLNALKLAGVEFSSAEFTPESSKHEGKKCFGSKIRITDRSATDPFWIGIYIVDTIFSLYPDQCEWRQAHFDRLCGTDKLRIAIQNRTPLTGLKALFAEEIEEFKELRNKYLLY